MSAVIALVKKIRFKQILTVFLAGVLLIASTACSGGALARTSDQVEKEVPSAVNNKYQGGMNNYSDVDARRDIKGADRKAKALVDNARQNVETKRADEPEQYVENYRSGTPLDQRVKNLGKDIGESVENVTEDVSERSQQITSGAKENAKDAAASTKRAADQAADTAQYKANQAARSTKQAVDDIAD